MASKKQVKTSLEVKPEVNRLKAKYDSELVENDEKV